MKVVVRPGDRGACGDLRLSRPAAACAEQGLDVTESFATITAGFDTQWIVQAVDLDADVVVIQRPMSADLVNIIEPLQRQGTAVVVEIDDDFHALPRENQAWPMAQREWLTKDEAEAFVLANKLPKGVQFTRSRAYGDGETQLNYYRIPEATSAEHKGHLMAACRRADLVTCTTPALAKRYAAHGRYAIIPNCIPETWLHLEGKPNERPTVGWTGVVNTHPGDLDVCGDGIARAVDVTGSRFRSVQSDRAANHLGVKDFEVQPWVPLEEYPQTVANLDVGIVPLAESPFNEAKSWLKGLEYAAAGVPFVASPTSPYRAFEREGAGALARGHNRWAEMVGHLLSSEPARAEMAGRGREVAARWTIEGNTHRWVEAWAQALANRRNR